MKNEGFDFVATGEVLGERPMSQHLQALKIVEREAGLKGYLLRPLSAKVLAPTVAELDGHAHDARGDVLALGVDLQRYGT